MKIIFLDIDGVMNSQVFYKERYGTLKSKITRHFNRIISKIKYIFNGNKHKTMAEYETPDSHYTFKHQFNRLKKSTCATKWKWLSDWCNENDVKICISSTWRNHFGNKKGRTPDKWNDALLKLGFKEGTYIGITTTRKSLRGEEIQDFLNDHKEVEDFAILDDDSDMLDDQFDKFHHCDPYFGLTTNHLYRIKRQFDKKSNYRKLTKTL